MPSSLLGFADSVPSRKGETGGDEIENEDTKTRCTPEATWEVMRINIVATLGMEGEKAKHGWKESSFLAVDKLDALVLGRLRWAQHK